MNPSARSREILQNFCFECSVIEKQNIPPIRCFVGRGARILTKIINVNGITLGRSVIINPDLIWRDEDGKLRAPTELIAHELAHVLQYERLGLCEIFIFLPTRLVEKSKT